MSAIHHPVNPSQNTLAGQQGSTTTNVSQQQGSFKGATISVAPGQLLPSNLEEVSLFKSQFKTLDDRKAGKPTANDPHDRTARPTQVSAAKAMEDAAEEAGMMVSANKSRKEVDKAKKISPSSTSDKGEESVDLDKLYGKVKDLDRKKISEFVTNMLANTTETPEELLTTFMGKLRDVTHKYMGLLEIKEQIKQQIADLSTVKSGDSERLTFLSKFNTLINQNLQSIMDEQGEAIRAGLNMTEVAMQYALSGGIGMTDQLRAFYRDYVMNYAALFEAYQKIMKRFKKAGFRKGKQFLMEALTADLESDGPSISEARLGAIMSDMKALRAIERVHDESDRLFDRLKKKYFVDEKKREILTENVLMFFNGANFRTAVKKKVEAVEKKMAIQHMAGKINLLNGLREIIASMPTSLFKNSTERRQVIQAVQIQLDNLISKEAEESKGEHMKSPL